MNFRIFIDAATLKQASMRKYGKALIKFPHLYRCGHIEAQDGAVVSVVAEFDFRIFIDAATLKHAWAGAWADGAEMKFPHLYRCGHIEAAHEDYSPPPFRKAISASL